MLQSIIFFDVKGPYIVVIVGVYRLKILVFSIVDLKKAAHNSRLHQLLNYWSKSHEITVLCISDYWKARWDTTSDEYNKDFETLFGNIKICYITERKISPILQDLFFARSIKKILREIKFKEFDLYFNYNGFFSGYVIAKCAKKNNIPIIYDIADDLPEMIATSRQIPPIGKFFGKFIGKYIFLKNIQISDKITLTTNIFQDIYKILPSKTIVIPNGVNTQVFQKKVDTENRKKTGLEKNFVIGHVGVLREWLDFRPLFDAVKQLIPTLNIKLLIVGGGIGYEEIVNLAKSYEISDNVIFTRTIPYHEIPDYIACMDVCTIPFKNDVVSQNALPLKLFEYMACEKPVVCTNVRTIHELFPNDILFVSNSKDYIKAITTLYQDASLRIQLGSRGRKIIENFYQWEDLSKKLEKIMIDITDNK